MEITTIIDISEVMEHNEHAWQVAIFSTLGVMCTIGLYLFLAEFQKYRTSARRTVRRDAHKAEADADLPPRYSLVMEAQVLQCYNVGA